MILLFLQYLTATVLPRPRVIYDRTGKSPYLSRHYLFGRPHRTSGGPPFDEMGNPYEDTVWPMGGWGLYLHRFHRSDADGALHSHPWKWAVSLVLSGGYWEDRRNSYCEVVRRWVGPGRLNFLRADDYHRVDLKNDAECWSLFLAGPKVETWYFWDPATKRTTPWREFINGQRDQSFQRAQQTLRKAQEQNAGLVGWCSCDMPTRIDRRSMFCSACDKVIYSDFKLHPDPTGGRYGDS